VQRLQLPPLDVPVPAGSPSAAGATTILVAPPSPPVPPAPRPPPLILPAPAPVIPPHPGPYRLQQPRSLADMANEQLRRGAKPKVDPMAQGMGDAALDDCLHAPDKQQMLGGLLAAPGLAARALSGRCAK
jgi:hypothetical protein